MPNLIIQYGKPRTATTLQFQILCLMMAYLHEDNINNVTCYFNNKNNGKHLNYNVIKTHRISGFLSERPSNTWIFLTSSDRLSDIETFELNSNIKLLMQMNFTIPYIADVNLVAKRGHFIVYEYQHIFGLSDTKMEQIAEYLRYWDILRVCCGKQMSADWRNHLAPSKNYKQHHDPHSPTYPACEMYNISEVERRMINTLAFKKLSQSDPLRRFIGKPEISDVVLDGTYCSRCNENIAKRNLKFNQKCN